MAGKQTRLPTATADDTTDGGRSPRGEGAQWLGTGERRVHRVEECDQPAHADEGWWPTEEVAGEQGDQTGMQKKNHTNPEEGLDLHY